MMGLSCYGFELVSKGPDLESLLFSFSGVEGTGRIWMGLAFDRLFGIRLVRMVHWYGTDMGLGSCPIMDCAVHNWFASHFPGVKLLLTARSATFRLRIRSQYILAASQQFVP